MMIEYRCTVLRIDPTETPGYWSVTLTLEFGDVPFFALPVRAERREDIDLHEGSDVTVSLVA